MKNLAIAFLLLFVWQSSAQTMVIHQRGRSDVRIPIADIARLTFDLTTPVGSIRPIVLKNIKAAIANILPNPFTTKIEYSIDEPALVTIRVIDLQGKTVRTIANAKMSVGHYTTTWNSRNDAGQRVGNAPYIVNVEINGQSISKVLFMVN